MSDDWRASPLFIGKRDLLGSAAANTSGVWSMAETIAMRYNDFITGPLPPPTALVGGGLTTELVNVIDRILIGTTGNAVDFGDLTAGKSYTAACSSTTRGVWGGGSKDLNNTPINEIDYLSILSGGVAQDFGDLTVARYTGAGCSSSTRGIFAAGSPDNGKNVIDYITIASVGNATDFGDLSTGVNSTPAGAASPTRGVVGGGFTGIIFSRAIDYFTIASAGNGTFFGNLTTGTSSISACSSSTRAVFAGGRTSSCCPVSYTDVMEYITIASTGNATDFGDLLDLYERMAGTSSSTRGLFCGGNIAPNFTLSNTIQYITIATTGSSTDFGDLTLSRGAAAACSNDHGGLQ